MSLSATDFLTNLAQTVSTMSLYEEGHPAREKAIDGALDAVLRLQEEVPTPEFTFVGDDIVFQRRPLHSLKRWGWASRLSAVGIQRLEFTGPVTRDDLEVFLYDVLARLTGDVRSTAEVSQTRPTVIQYGIVGIKGQGRKPEDGEERSANQEVTYTLREEVDAVDWIHSELKEDRGLHVLEAEAIVRSLSVAMHGDQQYLMPLLRLKRFDQYTTTHAMNVSVLTMALAEFIGLESKEIRAFGMSGLVHDLGKVTVPADILNKPGRLTDQEREVMNNGRADNHRDRGAPRSGRRRSVRAPHQDRRWRISLSGLPSGLSSGKQPCARLRRLRRVADPSPVSECVGNGAGACSSPNFQDQCRRKHC